MHFLRSIVNRRSSIVILSSCLFLFTIHLSLFTTPVQAYDPPSPQPCQNAKTTQQLTDNYITDENGEPPPGLSFDVEKTGSIGDTFSQKFDVVYQVDFSKLQSIFGRANSNYLEGKYQDEEHRTDSIFGLSKSDFNKYHGAAQKAIPKSIVDQAKIKYVQYILENSTLPEASSTYTDTDGQNPKRIFDLYNDFTKLPSPPASQEDRTDWLNSWGKYWEKIPTAYREFYNGYLNFSVAESDTFIRWAQGNLTQTDREKLENASGGAQIGDVSCLPLARDPIRFVMPEFARTVGVSDQLNQAVVPCSAQSFRHAPQGNEKQDDCGSKSQQTSQNSQDGNLLSKVITLCKKILATPEDIVRKFKDATKTSLRFINPIKEAFAQSEPCLVKLDLKGKEGSAPFCALPDGQLQNGDQCIDKPSENKLDKNNTNVICNFKVSYTATFKIDPNSPQWNSCTQEGASYKCTTKVRIFPNFRIPFLAEIWNNTTYSEKQGGTYSNQKTGRPGIYSMFTPKTIFEPFISKESFTALQNECKGNTPEELLENQACTTLMDLYSQVVNQFPNVTDGTCVDTANNAAKLGACFGPYFSRFPSKSQPGESKTETGIQKERFIGGADCNKFVARDLSLKPLVLQQYQGISGIAKECVLQTSNVQVTGPVDIGNPPPSGTADCGSASSFSQLLPNPVPQSVGAVSPSQLSLLDSGDVVMAAKNAAQITGTPCELLVGLHYVEANWGNGSFISGRPIGAAETDISLPSDCTSAGGTFAGNGCVFSSLEQTAIYAGFLIQVKVSYLTIPSEQRPPKNFEEMIGAMSYYNGGGNHNCGWGTAYAGPCPPPTGIDDPYALSHFDNQYATMFLIYCGDLQLCNPPEPFNRDGAATAAKEFYLKNKM